MSRRRQGQLVMGLGVIGLVLAAAAVIIALVHREPLVNVIARGSGLIPGAFVVLGGYAIGRIPEARD